MTTLNEYQLIRTLAVKPAIWNATTTADLWTDKHISANMLTYHLDPLSEPASRPHEFIDRSAAWIADRFSLAEGVRVMDLGCGPGLYTSRFHDAGAEVTGVDFSTRSLAYARADAEKNKRSINYIQGNYLEVEFPGGVDLVTLIYCDYCALSPEQRRLLLKRIREILNPGGRLFMDVFSPRGFAAREESTEISENLMDGFWAPGNYIGVRRTWLYEEEMVALDRYDIFETSNRKSICNWLQYYSPEELEKELDTEGFSITGFYSDVAGSPVDPESHTMAVIAE